MIASNPSFFFAFSAAITGGVDSCTESKMIDQIFCAILLRSINLVYTQAVSLELAPLGLPTLLIRLLSISAVHLGRVQHG